MSLSKLEQIIGFADQMVGGALDLRDLMCFRVCSKRMHKTYDPQMKPRLWAALGDTGYSHTSRFAPILHMPSITVPEAEFLRATFNLRGHKVYHLAPSMLQMAWMSGDLSMVKWFVRSFGIGGLYKLPFEPSYIVDQAIRVGHIEVAKWAYELYGMEFSWPDSGLIEIACARGDKEAVCWLITCFRYKDQPLWSPLASALMSKNSAMIAWVLETFEHKPGEVDFTTDYCGKIHALSGWSMFLLQQIKSMKSRKDLKKNIVRTEYKTFEVGYPDVRKLRVCVMATLKNLVVDHYNKDKCTLCKAPDYRSMNVQIKIAHEKLAAEKAARKKLAIRSIAFSSRDILLCEACVKGDLAAMIEITEHFHFTAGEIRGHRALELACEIGRLNIVQWMFRKFGLVQADVHSWMFPDNTGALRVPLSKQGRQLLTWLTTA